MIPVKPAETTWTDEQWEAIYKEGSNIIVSAGAGSGKTAVLTERIIEKLKSGVSISSLVVLTFTKAAAFEMKTRVRKKIKKEIEKGNLDLEKELEKIDSASITTFDSYSLSLVKKYHYLLGIKKDIGIADNIVLGMKKREFIDEVFDSFYQKKDSGFLKLLDTFTIKDDDKIKNVCLKLNDSLESIVHKKEYLDTYLTRYYETSFVEDRIKEYERILNQEKEEILDLLTELKRNANHPVSVEFVLRIQEILESLYACANYDDYRIISSLSIPAFTRSKKIDGQELLEMKEIYDELKEHFIRFKELCVYEDRASLKNSIFETRETVETLIAILKEFDRKLLDYKMKESLYEFSDIGRLAITLLESYPLIAEQIKKETSEIMIDEYQDTNDIGDYFISLIANHNVYMVGDIKQSIYRFRNANPNIFMDKYSRYSVHQDGEKIDLNKNFRSRREVLDDINFLFEKFMDEEIGGANYKLGHAMIFGNKEYEKEGKTVQNYHFEILDYEYKKTEYAKSFRTEEIEAFIIANDIQNKIESHYKVYDKDKHELRDIVYNDFSILLDRKTSFDLYKKIFTYLGVPLLVHKDEEFVYSDEVFVITNIMKWIHSILDFNYAKDHLQYAVMSISRSFLSKIEDEKLFEFFMEYKENFVEGLNGSSSPVCELHKKMQLLAEYSLTHTLSELLEQVYQVFNIYQAILNLQNIELLSIKLDYLLDVSRNLEKMGYQIFDFINYLEEAMKGNTDVTFSRNQEADSNSVNLMSIHKSKGLEYHICYYAGLQKNFSKADLKEKFLFDQKLGFIVPHFEEGIRENFYKELLKEEWNKEDISERIRVFYVALSRAKEKMIFVTNLSDKESTSFHDFVDSKIRLKYKSFYDILLSVKSKLKPYIVPYSLDTLLLTKNYEQLKETNYESLLEKSNCKTNYISLDILKRELEEKSFSSSYHIVDSNEQNRLSLGIRLHECLQYIDYNNIEESLNKMNLSDFEYQKLKSFYLNFPLYYYSL
ncbi:MAG: UvrD-helicase domain-containing protein, partial [Bacilli bacterium]|nr:UvrD-helicase domain-containing protein [Bacilli bacterium]